MSLVASSGDDIWDPHLVCIDQCSVFAGLSGAVLQDRVFKTYQEQDEFILVPYFAANGDKLLLRDQVNNRTQLSVRKKYKRGVLTSGVTVGGRSEAWATLETYQTPDGPVTRAYLLTAATLTEAVYDAQEENPDSDQVKITISRGVWVRPFLKKMPAFARRYLRDAGNAWNNIAASTSFLENYLLLDDATSAWTRHANEKGITARDGDGKGTSYESLYRTFVMGMFKGRWTGFLQFGNAVSFKNSLVNMKIWLPYVEYLNNHCSFASHELDTNSVLAANHALRKAFAPYPGLKAILCECLKMAVPTDDLSPWLFTDGVEAAAAMLLWPMVESKTFKLNRIAQSAAVEEQEEPPAKRSKKAAAKKCGKKAAPTVVLNAEHIQQVVQAGDEQRSCMFAEDVVHATEYVLQSVVLPNPDAVSWAQ